MLIAPEQWPALSRLMDEALELEPAARPRWLDTLRPADAALAGPLRALLDAHARAETSEFLGALPRLGGALDAAAPGGAEGTAAPGSVVGGYVVEHEAGRGGMSVVYRAHRADGLIKRPVALKLLHAGRYGTESLARFARERDILAGLNHPHIARLYDAGTTAAGQPYIALEFVDGAPLTTYCDTHRLDVRARVVLFRQVLAAVQFAHSNLVIHRDLKPSNILVTGSGEVRLLDFGIAKPLQQDDAGDAAVTEVGLRALTPDYASPEQIRGEPVSTASDVYALGVVLCELLCGSRPYPLARRSAAALEDAILSADPVRPSAAPVTAAVAAQRASTPRALGRALGGDLDTIVLKALKKSPADRYSTADAFDQDLARYLAREPVLARPDAAWYRARRLLARHWLAAASTLLVLVALATGLAVALWQARRAATEAQTAKAVEAFMAGIFRANGIEQPDPLKAQQATARELLARGGQQVNQSLATAPEARLRTLKILADTEAELGLMDDAAALRRERVSLARSLHGPDAIDVGYALIELSDALQSSKGNAERPAVLAEATRILDLHHDDASDERGRLLRQLAQAINYREPQKAQQYLTAAVALYRRRQDVPGLIDTLAAKGSALSYGLHDARGALPLLLEAARLCESVPLPCQSRAPQVYGYLGDVEADLGDLDAAEQAYRRALASALAHQGPDHADTIQVEWRLGAVLYDSARIGEGLAVLRSAYERAVRAKGADDGFHVPITASHYAVSLLRAGAPEEAAEVAQRAVTNYRRYRPDGPLLISYLDIESACLRALGRDGAMRELEAQADALAATLPPGNKQRHTHTRWQARRALEDGDPARAARWVADEHFAEDLAEGPLNKDRFFELQLAAQSALANGNPKTAIAIATGMRARIAAAPHPAYFAPFDAQAAAAEGEARLVLGEPVAAAALLQSAADAFAALYDRDHSVVYGEALVQLAQARVALGDRSHGRALAAQARRIYATHAALGARFTQPLRELEAKLRPGRRA